MRDSFIFYKSFMDAIEKIPQIKYRYLLLESIIKVGLFSQESIEKLESFCIETEQKLSKNYTVLAIFLSIKPQLIANYKKYLNGCKGAKKGALGGAPLGNKNASKTTPKQPLMKMNNENVECKMNNENDNDNENDLKKEEKIKKEEKKNSNLINPDMCFDNKINQVFTLYKKLCPKLIPLVFEERNLDRRIEIDEFLALINDDFNYIEELFKRANKQITFYDNKINLKSLIKNHESIYQGLGAPKNKDEPDYKPPKKTGIIECVL